MLIGFDLPHPWPVGTIVKMVRPTKYERYVIASVMKRADRPDWDQKARWYYNLYAYEWRASEGLEAIYDDDGYFVKTVVHGAACGEADLVLDAESVYEALRLADPC